MSLVKSLTLAFALCLVTFCYVSPTSAQAQSNKPAGSVQGESAQAKLNELNSQLDSLMRELKVP